MKTTRIIALAASCLSLGACATITRGTTSDITVTSEPPAAEARLSTGMSCPQTPCTFKVSRKDEFIVVFSKPGYETQEIPVKTQVAGAGVAGFAGNILIGGVVGMAADTVTGAALEHVPNPVHAYLKPLAQAPVQKRQKRRASKPTS